MTDFKHLLDQAADDQSQPVRTDLADLLDRAQRGRRRQRARTWGAAVALTAAVAVAAPLAVTNLRFGGATPSRAELAPAARSAASSTPAPASTPATSLPSSPPATAPATTALEPTEILSRCQPQMAKYDPLVPGAVLPPWKDWRVIDPERSYGTGDMVAIGQSVSPYQVTRLCIIPEAGHEDDPVSFADLEPGATDGQALAQRCSLQMDLAQPPSIDLRGATLVRSMSRGGVTVALLEKDGKRYGCSVNPVSWTSGAGGAAPVKGTGTEFVLENTTIDVKPKANVTQPAAAFYYAAGMMSDKAASITVSVKGHSPARFPVTDGEYAFVLHLVGEEGIRDTTTTVEDAQGKVLSTQQQLTGMP